MHQNQSLNWNSCQCLCFIDTSSKLIRANESTDRPTDQETNAKLPLLTSVTEYEWNLLGALMFLLASVVRTRANEFEFEMDSWFNCVFGLDIM